MTRPRLQMKCPHRSTSASCRQAATWESYVQDCYANFSAPFAANEGVDAIIRYMAPGRRRLIVDKVNDTRYLITNREGQQLVLCQKGEDSLLLCLRDLDHKHNRMELGYYDATDIARFIGHIFSEYRKHQSRRRT